MWASRSLNSLRFAAHRISVRHFCSNPPPQQSQSRALMDFPPVIWPSIFLGFKNWIFSNFIIRPHLDPEFNMQDFIDGSKHAVQVISESLGESNFKALRELVSTDAYEELSRSVSQMSLAERENLFIDKDDIYLCFPYQVGIMFENDERRWVEITMVYHVLKGLKEMKEKGDSPSLSLGYHQTDYREKLHICNYRFIREYTKGIQDSSWLANIVNHFSLPT